MKYSQIVQGTFLERPNRFIAYVDICSKEETVHVKNTGRCKELLKKGSKVYLEKSNNPNRKTAYDLVAVEKNDRLINMDSQAPNKVVEEWLYKKELFPNLVSVRPETKYGDSRFDFYIETKQDKIFMEVKGVTLEEDGEVRFPDAPSLRAVKHLEGLIKAREEGYQAYVIFVVQMENVKFFEPNSQAQQEFTDTLIKARNAGVQILAYDCKVTPDELILNQKVPVKLEEAPLNMLGDIARIPEPLLKWYDSHKRILPWREDVTPYRVWVSEIMLQQTRVEAVKPFFDRFMKALPSIKALAEAEEETILKLWEGLGYYNRVRNLQKGAIQVIEEYNGQMPQSVDELMKLKGIGSYTAGAIASIAFGVAAPAVDGNVLRVISRIRMDEETITDTKYKKRVEDDIRLMIPQDRPGDFNQGMMEIGACVCIPNGAPHCEICPLETICMAHEAKRELDFPKKAQKQPRKIEEKTILIVQDANKAALRKRPGKGLLAGMYEFPSLEGHKTETEVVEYLKASGLNILRIQALTEAKHIFSHKEWHMKGFMVRVDELEPKIPSKEIADWIFMEPSETQEKYPVPTAFEAYTKYLNILLGNQKYSSEKEREK